MKTILAPTNFSQTSLHAVEYATDLATALCANLILIHVIEIPVTGETLTDFSYTTEMDDAKEKLSSLQSEMKARAHDSIRVETFAGSGILLQKLEYVIDMFKPLCMVMGTKERGLIEKMFIGNSTDIAIQTLPVPILVVPKEITFKNINKICLACDLKDIYDLPLAQVREFVHLFNVTLDIVHICRNEKEKSETYLAGTLVKEKLKDLNPNVFFIIDKHTDSALLKFAKEHGDDILFVIPKKRNFIQSLFTKSYSKLISKNQELPVVNIH